METTPAAELPRIKLPAQEEVSAVLQAMEEASAAPAGGEVAVSSCLEGVPEETCCTSLSSCVTSFSVLQVQYVGQVQ